MFHKLKCFQNVEIDILWNERESRHGTFDVVCKWDQIPQIVLFVLLLDLKSNTAVLHLIIERQEITKFDSFKRVALQILLPQWRVGDGEFVGGEEI